MKEGITVQQNNWLITIAMVGAVFLSYYIIKRQKKSGETSFVRTLVNAGVPDQVDDFETDQLENAKMVSEGSQYGVQYFNHAMEELNEEIDERIQH